MANLSNSGAMVQAPTIWLISTVLTHVASVTTRVQESICQLHPQDQMDELEIWAVNAPGPPDQAQWFDQGLGSEIWSGRQPL